MSKPEESAALPMFEWLLEAVRDARTVNGVVVHAVKRKVRRVDEPRRPTDDVARFEIAYLPFVGDMAPEQFLAMTKICAHSAARAFGLGSGCKGLVDEQSCVDAAKDAVEGLQAAAKKAPLDGQGRVMLRVMANGGVPTPEEASRLEALEAKQRASAALGVPPDMMGSEAPKAATGPRTGGKPPPRREKTRLILPDGAESSE